MCPTYCTILATNYLPKALALGESLRRHEDGARLAVLLIDAPDDGELPELEGVEMLSTASLGLPERHVLDLAMGYNLIEFATAVKPLLLAALLRRSEQVFYLDPDTYVQSPMVELGPALADSPGGILLTPHFLEPPAPGVAMTEGHTLLVGVYNLGFCGVDRRASRFLEWWWDRLRFECLLDPLSGLFVDQKWMDIGSQLFQAGVFRHSGYNVGVGNLRERPLAADGEGVYVVSTGERLRLFHFHAFDPATPDKLSVRFRHSRDNPMDDAVLLELCKEYAAVVTAFEHDLPPAPAYRYGSDSRGRRIPKVLRRVHRTERQRGSDVPSPFVPGEADAYDRWRRRAWGQVARGLTSDLAKCGRIVLPEEFVRLRRRFPGLADRLGDRFSGGPGLWG